MRRCYRSIGHSFADERSVAHGLRSAQREKINRNYQEGNKMIKLKHWRSLAVIMLAVTAVACSTLSPPKNETEAQLKDIQQELHALRGDVGKVNEHVADLDARFTSVAPHTARYNVDLGDGQVLGNPNAPVAIVEFSDFQCPFCQRFHALILPLIKQEYIDTGKAKLIFRHAPLESHPQGQPAALAAACAGQQSGFWSYADGLYGNQQRLAGPFYSDLAKEQQLDVAKFDACLKEGKARAEIDADLKYARAYGVDGTPTFFIGRVAGNQVLKAMPLSGLLPYPVIATFIDQALAPSEAKDEQQQKVSAR